MRKEYVSLGNKTSTIDITEGRDIQKPMLGVSVESCYYHESTWPSLRIPPYTNSLFIRLIPTINKYKTQTLGLLSRWNWLEYHTKMVLN